MKNPEDKSVGCDVYRSVKLIIYPENLVNMLIILLRVVSRLDTNIGTLSAYRDIL